MPIVAVRTLVRHCWLLLRPDSGSPMSFAITCDCGGSIAGVRCPQHQILPCPICRQPLFVLPRSRWPTLDGEALPRIEHRLRPWRMPLLAGIITLVLVGAAFWALLPLLTRPKHETPFSSGAADEIRQRQTSARQALAAGEYHQALKELDTAKDVSDRHPEALERDERNQLEQLYRQSDLLASLLSEPLQEIVKQASLANDDWQTRFEKLYRGQAVLFDDQVHADGMGRASLLTYEVRLGDEKVRLAIEDLRIFRTVSLDPPPRVLFGARLAKVAHEAGGWVIRFEPDSGVLFTDRDAACCVPLDDELLSVLERQKKWVRMNSEQK